MARMYGSPPPPIITPVPGGGDPINADQIADGTTNRLFTTSEKNKLAAVAAGATANATNAELRDRATHSGTQSADTIVDGTTNKAFSATDKNKLDGIATGATANSSDATLKNRANHTGTQSADTIVDGTTNKAFTAAEKTKLGAITGTNTGDQTSVSGNAGTATKLATARKINGVNFDGSANITIADATKVSLTGDESIAGVKSFADPVYVPDPFDDGHATPKGYVDDAIDTAVPPDSEPTFVVDPTLYDDNNLAAALASAPSWARVIMVAVGA